MVNLLRIIFLLSFLSFFVTTPSVNGQNTPSKKVVKKSTTSKKKKKSTKEIVPAASLPQPTTSSKEVSNINSVKVEPFNNNMGTLTQGVPKSATFTVTNNANVPIVLKEVKGGCGCTTTDYSKEPIPPGKTATFKATYDAASEGDFSKSVKVTTNLESEPILVIISGKVVAKNKNN